MNDRIGANNKQLTANDLAGSVLVQHQGSLGVVLQVLSGPRRNWQQPTRTDYISSTQCLLKPTNCFKSF